MRRFFARAALVWICVLGLVAAKCHSQETPGPQGTPQEMSARSAEAAFAVVEDRAVVNQAIAALNHRDMSKAAAMVEDRVTAMLEARRPLFPLAMETLVRARVLEGQSFRAEDFFDRLLKAHPGMAALEYGRGLLYLADKENPEPSLKLLREAFEHDPGEPRYAESLAELMAASEPPNELLPIPNTLAYFAQLEFASPESPGPAYALGVLLYHMQSYDTALEKFQKATRSRFTAPPMRAASRYREGLVLSALRRPEDAVEAFLEAAEGYTRLGLLLQAADARSIIASLLITDGSLEEAEVQLERALEVHQAFGELRGLIADHRRMAVLRHSQGHYVQAEVHAIQARDFCQLSDDRSCLADMNQELGQLQYLLGEYPAARSYWELAVGSAASSGSRSRVSTAWGNLGRLSMSEGKIPESIYCFYSALYFTQPDVNIKPEFYDEFILRTAPTQAALYEDLGKAYEAWGMFETARTHYLKARSILVTLGRPFALAGLRERIGRLELETKNLKESRSAFSQVLAAARSAGNAETMTRAQIWIALVETGRGNTNAVLAALKVAMGQAEVSEDPLLRANVHALQGEMFLKKGSADKALQQSREGLRLLPGLQERELKWRLLSLRGRALARGGKENEASSAFEAAAELAELQPVEVLEPVFPVTRSVMLSGLYDAWSEASTSSSPEEAYASHERRRGQVFSQVLKKYRRVRKGIGPGELRRLNVYESRIRWLRARSAAEAL